MATSMVEAYYVAQHGDLTSILFAVAEDMVVGSARYVGVEIPLQ